MALACSYWVFFFLFCLVFFTHPSDCSKCHDAPFICGDLTRSLEFPFSDISKCGLFEVNCTSHPPTVKFGAHGRQLNVHKTISKNEFFVTDPLIHSFLKNESCSLQNLSPPSSSFNITYYPNTTILSCIQEPHPRNHVSIGAYFGGGYKSYSCRGFDYYYSEHGPYASTKESPLPDCSMIIVPVKPEIENKILNWDLLEFLTSDFKLAWNVSNECLSCRREGRMCPSDKKDKFRCEDGEGKQKNVVLVSVVVATIALAITLIFLLLVIWRKAMLHKLRQLQKRETGPQNAIEMFLENNGNLAPRRYRYSDLKKMTKSFTEKLGKGGYGCVYKGKLPDDGRIVAVKVPNEPTGNGQEFMNEIASISRTSHVNIVALLGFCFEDSRRAMIYEFMPNGSLEKFLRHNTASPSTVLGWDRLINIAIGTARGLEYLHQGCNMRILHFDIKPQNILLDKDFNPKISDFGLAKMCPNRSSIVSMLGARGTIGYIAPEVFCRNFGGISYKSDVYSYGMMVLEMVMGRQDLNNHSSEMYFPDWIYKQLEVTNAGQFCDNVTKEDDWKIARKWLLLGCGVYKLTQRIGHP